MKMLDKDDMDWRKTARFCELHAEALAKGGPVSPFYSSEAIFRQAMEACYGKEIRELIKDGARNGLLFSKTMWDGREIEKRVGKFMKGLGKGCRSVEVGFKGTKAGPGPCDFDLKAVIKVRFDEE